MEIGNKKYLEGYLLILQNAKSLIESAKLLAKKKNYALANSLLIIAGEEAIKAFFTFVRYNDPETVIEEFEQSFKRHKIKLKSIGTALFWIGWSSLYTEKYFNPFTKYLESTDENTSKKDIEETRHRFAMDYINSLKKTMEKSVKESEWWEKQAQTEKEKGIYVNKTKQGWVTPAQITKTNYEITKKHVLKLVQSVDAFRLIMKNEDFFQKMSELMKENARKIRELNKLKP